MKHLIKFFGIILLLNACATTKVISDIDKDTNFDNYKTYAWPATEQPLNNDYPQYDNSLNRKRWKNAIDAAMQREGYVLGDNTSADVELDFHIQFEHNTVIDYSYHNKEANYHMPVEELPVYRYDRGSMTIHMIDTKKKHIVWQGVSTRILDIGLLEDAEENIQKAVNKLFEKFHSQIAK